MRVRSIDIANALGVSKATVSMALNDRPGVSPETRQAVLRCKEELEQSVGSLSGRPAEPAAGARRRVVVIQFDRGLSVTCNMALENMYSIGEKMESSARKYGFATETVYANLNSLPEVLLDCRSPEVSAVFINGAELQPEDIGLIPDLNMPLLIGGCDFSDRFPSVVVDNQAVVRKAVRLLAESGCRRICFAGVDQNIYNFEQRRLGFLAGVFLEGLSPADCPLVRCGRTSAEAEAFFRNLFRSQSLPDAFITENYSISQGLLNYLHSCHTRVPEDVSLIGIDTVPSYMTYGIELTSVGFDYAGYMDAVFAEIAGRLRSVEERTPCLIAVRSSILPGQTVRQTGL